VAQPLQKKRLGRQIVLVTEAKKVPADIFLRRWQCLRIGRRIFDLVEIATVMVIIVAARFLPAQSCTFDPLDSDVKPT